MPIDAMFLYDTVQSAIAGVIAAVVAAILLESARGVRRWIARRRDVKYIRELVIEGRERILNARVTYNERRVKYSEDFLRAAQYNHMIKKLRVGLEKWTPNLSHAHRRDLMDALDWYHTGGLHLVKGGSHKYESSFQDDFPEGKWPTEDMKESHVTDRFTRLQAIRWLKLPPVH